MLGLLAGLTFPPPAGISLGLVVATAGACALALGRGRAPIALGALLVLCLVCGWAWSGARVAATAPAPAPAYGPVSGVVVIDTPPLPDGHGGLRMRARVDGLRMTDGVAIDPDVRLLFTVRDVERPLVAGQRLRVTGRLRPAATRASPDWWHRWLERQRISARLSVRAPKEVGRRGGLVGVRDRWRAWATAGAGAGLVGDTAGLVRGMALGGSSMLSEEAGEAFRDAGIWHLLAVSGQNVTVVAIAVLFLLRALGAAHRPSVAGAAAVMVAYCLACDGGASVARAGTVGGLGLLAELRGSRRERWTLLVGGLALLLAHQPRSVHDPGLQLSFAAVAGLFAIGPPMAGWVRRILPGPLAELAGMSIGAGLATAPVVSHHFERLSLVGFVVNIVAVPLAAPIVVIALAGIAAGAITPVAGVFLAHLAAVGADLLLVIAHAAAALPGATAPLGSRATPLLIALAVAPVVASWWTGAGPRTRDPRRLVRAGACLVVAIVGAWLLWPRAEPHPWPDTPAITMLDVGQGDAILLRAPTGETILVDAGPPGSPPPVVAALRRHGVSRLDVLVITHSDADHLGGAPELIDRLPVGALGHPPTPIEGWNDLMLETLVRAEAGAVPTLSLRNGDEIAAGPWRASVLAPAGPARPGESPNDAGVVMVARVSGLSALLTGDAESPVLSRLALGPVDVLKVSHHGSEDPGLPAILARIRPRGALISAGEGNSFGHPHPSVLEALATAAVPVARTDLHGDVTVAVPGEGSIALAAADGAPRIASATTMPRP